jgi:uncharacterized protein YecE (DUF72 family)
VAPVEGLREVAHPSTRSSTTSSLRHRRGLDRFWKGEADRRGPRTPVDPSWATAPSGYVRFHGGLASPRGCYGEAALEHWLERIRATWAPEQDVFLYWNNDRRGCAPRDAARLAVMADSRYRGHADT